MKSMTMNPTKSSEIKNDSGAVIVCGHVASKTHPILFAERNEPEEPVDTGWQFLCDSGLDETPEAAQVWALDEILAFEPTLNGLLEQRPGTRLVRKDPASPWQVIKPS